MSGKWSVDLSVDSGLGQSREHAQSGSNTLDTGERHSRERNMDVMALKSLLTDCSATSVSHLRWVFSSTVSGSNLRVCCLNSKLIEFLLLQRDVVQA